MIAVHVVLAPLLLPIRARAVGKMLHEYVEAGARTLPADVGSTLVIVNAPDPLIGGMAGAVRYYQRNDRNPIAARLRQLSVVVDGEAIAERVDDHTLSLSAEKGFFHDPFSEVFRSASIPFHVGDVVDVAGMRAEILDVGADGLPHRMQFRFESSLDDPGMVWVTWVDQGFVRFTPPARGEKVSVPSVRLVEVLSGQKR